MTPNPAKRHIKLLPAIIFVFFGSVNALKDNEGASNPIIEAVFDLMVNVLIPVTLFIDIDKEEIKYFRSLPELAMISLQIWFCVIVYQTTRDFFFIIYLLLHIIPGVVIKFICNFIIIFLKKKNRGCKRHVFFLLLFRFMIIITIDVVFLFLAVERNYVDRSTFCFVIVPIIIASCIGVWILNVQVEEELDHQEMDCDACGCREFLDKFWKFWNIKAIEKIARPMWIRSFCSHLIFCSIVGPSTLWIKVYLTLGFLSYNINKPVKAQNDTNSPSESNGIDIITKTPE